MLQLWHISQAARRQIAWIWLNHGLKQCQQQQHQECHRLCVSLCVCTTFTTRIFLYVGECYLSLWFSVCARGKIFALYSEEEVFLLPLPLSSIVQSVHFTSSVSVCVCVYVCLSMRECVRRHPRTPDQSRLFTRRQIPVNFILKIALQYVHSPRNGPDYNWRLTSQLPLPFASVQHWHWELGKLTICTQCAGKYTIEELFLSAYIGFQLKWSFAEICNR